MNDVRLVEIEIHSFCNRTCSWCPNSLIDRKFFEPLAFDSYCALISDLKKHRYTGRFSFSRYNEPLYDPELLIQYIRVIKDEGLEGEIVFNTNGDYLDFEVLNRIAVDDLTIMDYESRGAGYYTTLFSKNKVHIKYEDDVYLYGMWKNKKILVALNWPHHALLEDRGGILNGTQALPFHKNRVRRRQSCFEPIYFIGIDYNGSVTPCCNIRSDYPAHEKYILGNIQNDSIVDIFHSSPASAFRRRMAHGPVNSYPFPCRHCNKEPGRYTRNRPGIFNTPEKKTEGITG